MPALLGKGHDRSEGEWSFRVTETHTRSDGERGLGIPDTPKTSKAARAMEG